MTVDPNTLAGNGSGGACKSQRSEAEVGTGNASHRDPETLRMRGQVLDDVIGTGEMGTAILRIVSANTTTSLEGTHTEIHTKGEDLGVEMALGIVRVRTLMSMEVPGEKGLPIIEGGPCLGRGHLVTQRVGDMTTVGDIHDHHHVLHHGHDHLPEEPLLSAMIRREDLYNMAINLIPPQILILWNRWLGRFHLDLKISLSMTLHQSHHEDVVLSDPRLPLWTPTLLPPTILQ